MRTSRRALMAAGLAFVAAGAGVMTVTTSASSAVAPSFSATAAAAGVRITVTAQNAPLTSTPVDAGGPVAQSQLDSLGTSQAFASFPYPGDLVISGPGTIAGLTGGKLPSLPAYPFYVSSTYPLRPQGASSQGPLSIAAKSDATSSRAQANAGVQLGLGVGSTTTASSTIVAPDGTVTATATSDTAGISLGLVAIGSIHGDATVVLTPEGVTHRSSHLRISGLTVAGVTLGFTDQGLILPSTRQPLPSIDPLNAALKGANIRFDYVAARPTTDGVISAAIQITTARDVPDLGASTVAATIGLDSARIAGAPAFAAPSPPPPPAGAPPAAADSPVGPVGPGVATIPAPVGVARAATNAPVALPSQAITRAVARAGRRPFSTSRFYPAIVAAGLVAVGLSLLISNRGVRLRWNS